MSFNPGDLVRGKLNPNYHMPNRPYFDTIEMKGGGDAVSAARAVLQTGEYDFAWNLQVEDEILKRLEAGGKGAVVITQGGSIEYIQLNNTDPWTTVDGERSSIKTKHPFLSDPAVRNALNLLVDRASVHKYIYGRTGVDTANFVNAPEKFASKNTSYEFNVDKAIKLLDDGGWKPGADGVREKNGVKLHAVYQTSINAPRQKTQEIVKQACQKAGISIEIKSVMASVFFSSDVANPDTYTQFYCDIQMYTTTMTEPDPGGVACAQFLSSEVASKANKWQGFNVTRWRNADYDRLYRRGATSELDPVKRAALFIAMNDMVIKDVVVIPVVTRPTVSAVGHEAARAAERLGQQFLCPAGLVSRRLTPAIETIGDACYARRGQADRGPQHTDCALGRCCLASARTAAWRAPSDAVNRAGGSGTTVKYNERTTTCVA